MPKKKLKIDITINVKDDNEDYITIDELDVSSTEFYNKTRVYLDSLYPDGGMADVEYTTFKSVDQDLDEI